MKSTEEERVTAFVRRYCTIENGDDALEPGYFGFYQGKNASLCKSVRASLAFTPDTDRAIAEVMRRVNELSDNGEGHVFLRAYAEGSTKPMSSLRVEGRTDETEPDATGSAVGDMASALVRTNHMLNEAVRERDKRIADYFEGYVDLNQQFTLAHITARLLEDGAGQAQMEAAFKSLEPTLQRLAPAMEAWLTSGMGLPEDPAERVRTGVGRIVQLASIVGSTFSKYPDLVEKHPDIVADLRGLVISVAPHCGLQVSEAPRAAG